MERQSVNFYTAFWACMILSNVKTGWSAAVYLVIGIITFVLHISTERRLK